MILSNREMARLGELLDEALTLTPEQRYVWLDSLPNGDQPLVRTLRDALLLEETGAGGRAALGEAADWRRRRVWRTGPRGRGAARAAPARRRAPPRARRRAVPPPPPPAAGRSRRVPRPITTYVSAHFSY